MNAGLFSSARHDWQTPRSLFDPLNDEFRFTVDAAASPDNALLPCFWTPETDALNQDWSGHRVWCNPPYGREQRAFIEKAAELQRRCLRVAHPGQTRYRRLARLDIPARYSPMGSWAGPLRRRRPSRSVPQRNRHIPRGRDAPMLNTWFVWNHAERQAQLTCPCRKQHRTLAAAHKCLQGYIMRSWGRNDATIDAWTYTPGKGHAVVRETVEVGAFFKAR